MKKYLLLLFLSTCLSFAQVPVTITGVVQDTTGAAATSGTVTFSLQPQNSGIIYFVTGTGIIAPQSGSCGIDGLGNIKNLALSGACTVWGTDVLQPGNLTYQIQFFPNGNQGNTVSNQCITGTLYNLSNPVFCPVIKPTPQGSTVITSPIQNNLIPATNGFFNIGSASLRYANGFFLNINTVTCTGCTSPIGYQTIQNATVGILQRTKLNFLSPLTCVDNPGNTSSDCGLSGTATYPSSGVIETGVGTTNVVPKFTNGATGVQGNSSITDNGTTVSTTENFSATGTVTGSNIPAGTINTGTGTTNTISKFTTGASGVQGNSGLTDDGTTITATEKLNATGNSAGGNVGLKNFSFDQTQYVSTSGSDSNDGLSPGTAKLTPQAAMNTATATGTQQGQVFIYQGTYPCPTTWYSGLAITGMTDIFTSLWPATAGIAIGNLSGVKFDCHAANVVMTAIANSSFTNIEFSFANSGNNVQLKNASILHFKKVAVTQAGTTAVPVLLITTTTTVQNPANNSAFNTFEDTVLDGPTSGTADACLKLAGLGAVNAGSFVTDNSFVNLYCSGNLKNGLDFELNSDTNYFSGRNFINNTAGSATGDAMVFNSATPASDQDANNEIVTGFISSGNFSHQTSMGQSSGHIIQSGAGLVNVLGGTPTYMILGSALSGFAPTFQINGDLLVKTLLCSSTTPTLTGFGTGASITSNNGSCSFSINVGTGGVASSGTITMNKTAAHTWSGQCTDNTTFSASQFLQYVQGNTTVITIANKTDTATSAAWVASDVLNCTATAN
jgi:hypothetical protein